MRLRTARRGANRGGLFWGCSDYPACKETLAYEGGGAVAAPSDSGVAPTGEVDLGPAPMCPEPGCSATMVLKTAHRGAHRGRPFWACPRYPDCEGARNIGDDADGAPRAAVGTPRKA